MPRPRTAAFAGCDPDTEEALTYLLEILGWRRIDASTHPATAATLIFVGDLDRLEAIQAGSPAGSQYAMVVPEATEVPARLAERFHARLDLPLDVSEAERIILAASIYMQ